MWYTILALICLVLIILWNPVFEHMTNADIQKKHDFHASNPKKWEMPNPEDTKEKLKSRSGKGTEVYGPQIPESEANHPLPVLTETKNKGMTYPDIYGPEVITSSGHKSQGNNTQNVLNLPEYDIQPASEFPAGPSEPLPYLNDFSKILKM